MRAAPTEPSEPSQTAQRAWTLTAWGAGVFSLLVGLVMLASHLSADTIAPLNSPQLGELKEQLRLHPTDEATKQSIRQLDLRQRQRYFQRMSQLESGVYLLLGGVAVFIFALSRCARYRKPVPLPGPKADDAGRAARAAAVARWSVAGSGAVIGTLLLALTSGVGTALPGRTGTADKTVDSGAVTPVARDCASIEELRHNWPRFRGAEGSGVWPSTNTPLEWNVKTGAGILWKTPVPARGFNSPIVWGDRIFLSGGDANKREVFCYNANSGQLVWRQAVTHVPGSPTQPPEIPDSTGYAACSMATDGRRVYASFANGDFAAFTLDGKPVWSKGFGALKNPYGHATSLTTWQDQLIVQLDQGDPEDNKSKLYALDGRTGQAVWQRPRKAGSSWATPIVIEAAGKAQIITLAVPFVISYAARDGAELWRVDCLNGEVTPSPVFAGGLVFIDSPSEKLLAIRPDGQGDVSKTHVAWSFEDNVPDITSPVSDGELVFILSSAGMMTCLDAKDGKKQWDHDFDMECHSSPAIAGHRLYLFSQKGLAVVLEAGRQFKELFRTEMGEAFHASPAFAGDRLILRGTTNLWCVGRPAK
jgi:outer membrane protein assembly factor BamB